MSDFPYGERGLQAEEVPLSVIADAVGTPFYCYSSAGLECAYQRFSDAVADLGAGICYALKANGNLAVVRTFANMGAGADVVSEGELRVALAAGVPAHRIVFSGVGKAASEMVYADRLNLQSEAEIVPIGTTCRLCSRTDCTERAVPSIQQPLHLDENVTRLSAYSSRSKEP